MASGFLLNPSFPNSSMGDIDIGWRCGLKTRRKTPAPSWPVKSIWKADTPPMRRKVVNAADISHANRTHVGARQCYVPSPGTFSNMSTLQRQEDLHLHEVHSVLSTPSDPPLLTGTSRNPTLADPPTVSAEPWCLDGGGVVQDPREDQAVTIVGRVWRVGIGEDGDNKHLMRYLSFRSKSETRWKASRPPSWPPTRAPAPTSSVQYPSPPLLHSVQDPPPHPPPLHPPPPPLPSSLSSPSLPPFLLFGLPPRSHRRSSHMACPGAFGGEDVSKQQLVRFGKFVKISFSEKAACPPVTRQYLLEKSRVVGRKASATTTSSTIFGGARQRQVGVGVCEGLLTLRQAELEVPGLSDKTLTRAR